MTHFNTRSKLAALAALTLIAGADQASAQASKDARAQVFQGLMDCKGKSDPAERLACYDAAVGAMDVAEKKGDIVVVDREQAKAVRRQAFGFSLPSLAMFEKGESPEELDQVALKAERVYRGGDGKWVFELEGGAVWAQTDTEALFREPKAGSKVEIRKASMGSYFMNVDGQRAVRARRVK